jgi:hypothetical protein
MDEANAKLPAGDVESLFTFYTGSRFVDGLPGCHHAIVRITKVTIHGIY